MTDGCSAYEAISQITSVLPKHFSSALTLRFSRSFSTGQGADARTTSASPFSRRANDADTTA